MKLRDTVHRRSVFEGNIIPFPVSHKRCRDRICPAPDAPLPKAGGPRTHAVQFTVYRNVQHNLSGVNRGETRYENMHGHDYLLDIVIAGRPGKDGFLLEKVWVQGQLQQLLAHLEHSYFNEVVRTEPPTEENMLKYVAVLVDSWISANVDSERNAIVASVTSRRLGTGPVTYYPIQEGSPASQMRAPRPIVDLDFAQFVGG